MPTEKTITKNIQAWLKAQHNLFHYKVHGDPFQTAGLPDLIICVNGHFVGLEVKRPGNKPTLIQAMTIAKIVSAHGWARVVYSLDDVKEIIEPLLLPSRRTN